MKILNKDEIDIFLWQHRAHGCQSVKSTIHDRNEAWMDMVTGEKILIQYEVEQ